MKKAHLILGLWILSGMTWAAFALIFLLRLHHRAFAVCYFTLAGVAFIVALRVRRKHWPKI